MRWNLDHENETVLKTDQVTAIKQQNIPSPIKETSSKPEIIKNNTTETKTVAACSDDGFDQYAATAIATAFASSVLASALHTVMVEDNKAKSTKWSKYQVCVAYICLQMVQISDVCLKENIDGNSLCNIDTSTHKTKNFRW